MLINWYPGHMNKARKKVKEIMPSVDIVIEVLDARLPFSSTNPMIEELRGDKPFLKVLSKSDLADSQITKQWQDFFRQQKNMDALAITTQNISIAKTIPARAAAMFPKRGSSIKPVRALIVGIPNVGKSTLINTLVGKKVASVGNEPAITKAQQKIKVNDGFVLIDTPGMTWPGAKNEMVNYRLAASGAIRDTALEYDDLAVFAMDYMLQRYPDSIQAYYHIKELPDSANDVLNIIAKTRGAIKNGRADKVRIGESFVRDLRAGKLGKLSFEEPLVSYRLRE